MDLEFDIYAMVNPKTPDDVLGLCKEALSELASINQILDDLLKSEREVPR